LNHVLSSSRAAWSLVMGPFLRLVTTIVEMRSANEKLRNLSHPMKFSHNRRGVLCSLYRASTHRGRGPLPVCAFHLRGFWRGAKEIWY